MTTPISFELAKLLKEKGFDKPITNYYSGLNLYTDELRFNYNDKTIGDSPMHKRNAGLYSAPTIAEVVCWIYSKYDIWVSILCDVGYDTLFTYKLYSTKMDSEHCIKNGDRYDSPTEAYEAAIEYVLKNLI